MDNFDNNKDRSVEPIDYADGGGLGTQGGKIFGKSYKKLILRYLTILDSKLLNKDSSLYVKSSSQGFSRTFEKTKCNSCGEISVVVTEENSESVCKKCGVVHSEQEYMIVNTPKVSSEENTLSPISQEVQKYIKKFKDKKDGRLIYVNTKIKVCVLWYLISRKKSIESKNRNFSLDEIISVAPKLAVGKKAAQEQRQQKVKGMRERKDTEHTKFSTLVQRLFPEFKITEKRQLLIIPLIEDLEIQEQNVRRKVEKRVKKIINKIYDDNGDCRIVEFSSKHKHGVIVTVIYLIIHELRVEDKSINFKAYTQKDICKKFVVNTATVQKNIRDFKKFDLY
jgi:transcription initiation factor TFIIIB Brf1 subunit/transcription initiation factor TFIIB